MRQIYLLASDADAAVAAEVEAMLRQRGYSVRRAQEQYAFPPARRQEVTLALWSRQVQFSSKQILFANRAIDAWTEGRLIFASLDNTFQPRGLGDVAAIDLSFAPGRIAAVWKLVEAAQEIDRAEEARRRASGPDDDGGGDGPEPEPEAPARKAGKPGGSFSVEHALGIGLVAAAAFGSAGFVAMPLAPNLLVGIAAVAWGGVAGVLAGYGAGRLKQKPAASKEAEAASPSAPAPEARSAPEEVASADEEASAGPSPVFVSYSRRDGEVVYPMVAEVEASGREVWIDKDEIHAGGNWAGMIVRAIRNSDTFCLMCSAEAFQSDNVRREIYIADKYKRKLLPVRLDSAEMPEDFEYFLIDRQWLDLTAANPEERALRLKQALGR